ncbi:MAG: S8 family serine peptidase [Candidatus Eisenbacteria bacterium]|nr:S8 family serine peptidase [Candidatus Eisenbacteria bacterium]
MKFELKLGLRFTPIVCACILLVLGAAESFAAGSSSRDESSFPSQTESFPPSLGVSPDGTVTLWVFLKDKGPSSGTAQAVSELAKRFSPRALARRAKVRSGLLVDSRDLPVSAGYVQSLRDLGFQVRATSKWLNAVSVKCKTGDRGFLLGLPFVKKVQRVASFPKREIPFEPIPAMPTGTDLSGRSTTGGPIQSSTAPGDTSFYGPTWKQLDLIQVPALHQEGFTGEGMFIGVLDTGFNLLHQALKNATVVAQWDFINWDSVTANEPGQDSSDQHNHGTMILGIIGGNKPGVYMGAAYGAEFALAKTEYEPSETPVEEDYWVAGLEWLDSLGVDLVTSSLGYIDWYAYSDMDGNTAVTTVAADMAVANGLSIFSANGNGGLTSYPYMIAPADGDSVMSIGAVDSLGVLWPQSSRGPTYDGRIKPEIVTQGKSVWCVNPNDSTGYGRANGTSCATPLAAGACALVLEKNPTWDPITLREAVRSTATNASSPDTAIGWGILQAQYASDYEIISVADDRTVQAGAAGVAINVKSVPNPFNPITAIEVELQTPERDDAGSKKTSQETSEASTDATGVAVGSLDVTASIFDVAGRCLRDFGKLRFEGNVCTVMWNGTDGSGKSLPSGVYFFAVSAGEVSETRKLVLLR